MITVQLRYLINADAFDSFVDYAVQVMEVAQRPAVQQAQFFLPAAGASNEALALFTFDSLTDNQRFRSNTFDDPACRAALRLARASRCIRRCDSTFLRPLTDTPARRGHPADWYEPPQWDLR